MGTHSGVPATCLFTVNSGFVHQIPPLVGMSCCQTFPVFLPCPRNIAFIPDKRHGDLLRMLAV